jgi:hypothetical protein
MRLVRAVVVAALSSLVVAVASPAPAALAAPRPAAASASSVAVPAAPTAPALPTDLPCRKVARPFGLVPPLGIGLPLGLTSTCAGIRPGTLVRTPVGLCTLAFLFRGSDGFRYMATAGHCLLAGTDEEEVTFPAGTGPPARDASGALIGTFVYAVEQEDRDFGLIRLQPEVPAEAQVCHFGGPTGTAEETNLATLGRLVQYGQGRLFGEVVPARSEVVVASNDDLVLSAGAAAPGDSGSPLLTADGRAVGVVVGTGPAVLGVIGTGLVFSTRLGPQLRRATELTGVGYELQTAQRR